MTLAESAVHPLFLERIPREYARGHRIIALADGGDDWHFMTSASTDPLVPWNTAVALGGCAFRCEVADPEHIAARIDEAYEAAGAADADRTTRLVALSSDGRDPAIDSIIDAAERDLLASDGKAPVIQLVDNLLFQAVQRSASDLHVQPQQDRVIVRHRIDGVLDPGFTIPRELLAPVISRIKVMGRMDVAEHLIPQDGRTSVRIGNRAIDLRISTLPTAFGERAVLRLLDSDNQLCEFDQLGMPGGVADDFLAVAARSHGIILVTGPTGSGKTTTLYATLRRLNSAERNIMTIEDPIEYDLTDHELPISQSQVNPKKGVNFANGLRHILRQDPDVIMVGEIRDGETARIAIQSSLTGHLVFSTLHTNSAVSAVTRLLDLGVEPYLVASSLSAVLAQRLVRRLCPTCRGGALHADEHCETCFGTGYRGRAGVFELLRVDAPLRGLIARGADIDELRTQARANGLRELSDLGRELVHTGVTDLAEVERVVHG